MAAAEQDHQFSLKVVMIKERRKVLYAEIDNDFADVVLSFLTMPLGTIVRLLINHFGKKAPILGSLNSLYTCLLDLNISHFGTEEGKQMLIFPRNASGFECGILKLQIDDIPPIKYFTCRRQKCVSRYYKMKCLCPDSTNTEIKSYWEDFFQRREKSAFTALSTSFLLTDDLEILTNSLASVFQILKRNSIEDTNVLEEKHLTVGLKEIMELLKASLVSKTPITDSVLPSRFVFRPRSETATLDERMKSIALAEYESNTFSRTQASKAISSDSEKIRVKAFVQKSTQASKGISSDSKKIRVKAFVQKSTSRVVLAQSRHDFIDFLFSLLTIPLGRVQLLLGDNTCLGSIHSLYRSISNSETAKYMKSEQAITRLLEPELPQCYLSLHQIFSIKEQRPPSTDDFIWVDPNAKGSLKKVKNWIDPKGEGSFVKEVHTALFVVTDDLKVSTPSSTSIISTLNQTKVPMSDIEELELNIGLEEALSILQASLTSKYALTNGLKPFLKGQLNQEK